MNVILSASKYKSLDYQNGYNFCVHVYNSFRCEPTLSEFPINNYANKEEIERGFTSLKKTPDVCCVKAIRAMAFSLSVKMPEVKIPSIENIVQPDIYLPVLA